MLCRTRVKPFSRRTRRWVCVLLFTCIIEIYIVQNSARWSCVDGKITGKFTVHPCGADYLVVNNLHRYILHLPMPGCNNTWMMNSVHSLSISAVSIPPPRDRYRVAAGRLSRISIRMACRAVIKLFSECFYGKPIKCGDFFALFIRLRRKKTIMICRTGPFLRSSK